MADSFVEAINAFKTAHSDAQLILYFGSSLGCPRFDPTVSVRNTFRLRQCLHPAIKTGMDCAFDASSGIPPDHWLAQFYPELQSNGQKVYVEACPSRQTYMKSLGFLCDLHQLINNGTGPVTPTTGNQGFNGLWDTRLVADGGDMSTAQYDRVGALFDGDPTNWPHSIPRLFNSKQADAICLHQNPFLNGTYTLSTLDAALDSTMATNYGDYLP